MIKKLLGLFSGKSKRRAGQLDGSALLFQRRLKRSLDLPPFGKVPDFGKLSKQIFITLLAAVVVMVPVRVVLAASGIALDAYSGTPTTIHVSGWGYSGGETVSIYLGAATGAPAATTTAAADSQFGPVAVIIPANAPQGSLPVIAIGSTSGVTGSNSYYVVQFTPIITPASTPNTPGGVVTVSGSGYAPNEGVKFYINGSQVGSATAGPAGSFTNGSLAIPDVTTGTYQLHGTGSSSGADAVYWFYIGGFYPSAYPSVYYILPGHALSFSGSGFAPGETIQAIQSGSSTPSSSFTADNTGAFANAGSVNVPLSLAGSQATYHITGLSSKGNVDVSVTVGQFFPGVYPSAYYIAPSDQISFSGGGFAPNESIQVTDSASPQVLATILADSNGSFAGAGSTTVPFTFAGTTRTFRLAGGLSHAEADTSVTVGQYYPSISPSAYYINPGQKLSVSGSGFAPNETVDLTMGAGSPTTTVTNASGMFATPFMNVPFMSGSNLLVTASGRNSHATASVTVTLGAYYPSVAPSAWYAYPGSLVSFTGTGFAPGEAVAIGGAGQLTSVTADNNGNFTSGTTTIPFGTSGSQVYTFTGALSHATTNISVAVGTLYAYADADTYYATPGTLIHVNGHGFAFGEGVTVSGGAAPVHVAANNSGDTGPVAVTLPFSNSSAIQFTLTGDTSGANAVVPVTLAPFTPQMNPDTWYTSPGTTVHFSGSGFVAGESVIASLNGISSGSSVATASGTIASLAVPIPISATSAHFVFTGSLSKSSVTVDIALAGFSPQVSPSTWYAASGSNVTFTGTGFASGESVTISSNASSSSVSVNSSGGFTSPPFALPYSGTAAHFTVTSSLTHVSLPVDIALAAFNPGISLSSYWANGGTPLTVTGMGFGGNENVEVAFAGQPLGSIVTDASGNFSLVTTVPYGTPGNKTVQAKGTKSGGIASATFTIPQVYTGIQLGSYAGAPGSAVTFIGSGYYPGEPINIMTDRTGSTVQYTFNADAAGNFNNSGWLIPTSFTGGPLGVTITGGHSFAANTITYWVTGP